MDCPHGIPLESVCYRCEFDREEAELEYQRADPYECMPFGDAMRMEDEAVFQDLAAGEGRDFEDEPESLQDEINVDMQSEGFGE